ncbi:neurofilament heavy polypeptide-like isoform X2 [Antennarius striatus]|uniref:neurofilament heavy polypeptide-like isoform X2 n=1 Tax=Antennarius striatus TaxID=241820 RepID=UPI0035B0D42C
MAAWSDLDDQKPEEESRCKESISITGVETKRSVQEEEKWMKLFPEIKKCLVAIPRQRFRMLNQNEGRGMEEEVVGRKSSGDPETTNNIWLQPLEVNNMYSKVRVRYVRKKVNVKMNHIRASSRLQPRESPAVNTDQTHRWCLRSSTGCCLKCTMECYRPNAHSKKETDCYFNHAETDHNYSINPNYTSDAPNGQSQVASLKSISKHNGGNSCSTVKKQPRALVFKKEETMKTRRQRERPRKEEKRKSEDSRMKEKEPKMEVPEKEEPDKEEPEKVQPPQLHIIPDSSIPNDSADILSQSPTSQSGLLAQDGPVLQASTIFRCTPSLLFHPVKVDQQKHDLQKGEQGKKVPEKEKDSEKVQPPQLNIFPDSSIPIDSTVTINQSPTQGGAVLHTSTSLLSSPPLLLHPEEDVVEVTRQRGEDGGRTNEACRSGVTDREQQYYKVEGLLQFLDEEMLTPSSSEPTKDDDDVTALNKVSSPPESISLVSEAVEPEKEDEDLQKEEPEKVQPPQEEKMKTRRKRGRPREEEKRKSEDDSGMKEKEPKKKVPKKAKEPEKVQPPQEEKMKTRRKRGRPRKEEKRKSEDDSGMKEKEPKKKVPKKAKKPEKVQPPQEKKMKTRRKRGRPRKEKRKLKDDSRMKGKEPKEKRKVPEKVQPPQDGPVLRASRGLLSSPPVLLHSVEEEDVVEVTRQRREDGGRTNEACRSGVTDREQLYYEVDVVLESLDEDLLKPSSSKPKRVDDDHDATALDRVSKRPKSSSLNSNSSSLSGVGPSVEVTSRWDLLQLLLLLRKTVLPAHWVPVLGDGPLLQLLQCSKLSAMADTIVHIRPDQCFYVTINNRKLPDTHALYRTHTPRITRLSQLVSLLLKLERLIVCQGAKVGQTEGLLEAWSSNCHLLVSPPCLTCRPCLQQEENDNEEGEEMQP